MAVEQRLVRLAIIGAGPKAAAIAAKASILNRARFGGMAPVHFDVSIFEPNEVGAHWNGQSAGYTDGEQQLCTLIERDLGFPYASGLMSRVEALALQQLSAEGAVGAKLSVDGQKVAIDAPGVTRTGSLIDTELQAQFSWSAFCANQGELRHWIDTGRKPPTHGQFSRYLVWALAQTDATLIKSRVMRMKSRAAKWTLVTKFGNGRQREIGPFDGVIATGPGPMASKLTRPASSPRIFDGIDFWRRREEIRSFLADPDATVAILGGGGTGAAMLAWLARNGYRNTIITLVTDQATVYTRTDNWFESRLFSDSNLWQNLSEKSQEDFFDRVNRGVVWNNVVADLEKLNGLTVLDGRATQIKALRGELEISVPNAVSSKIVRATIAVDATGFDPWYFTKMLPRGSSIPSTREEKNLMKRSMTEFLDWQGTKWALPPLHAPMLSDKWGPGLGSLMSLGAMSDRILGRYLT